MSLKSNDAWTRAKCRREFVKVETSRLLQQEAGAATGGRGEGWGRGGGEVGEGWRRGGETGAHHTPARPIPHISADLNG